MSEAVENKKLSDIVIDVIKTVYDPEIPVDIFELGLIYDIRVNEENFVDVDMTLTSPSCPVAESLPAEVEQKIKGIQGVQGAQINLVWDPPWDQTMMSEEAQLELGLL